MKLVLPKWGAIRHGDFCWFDLKILDVCTLISKFDVCPDLLRWHNYFVPRFQPDEICWQSNLGEPSKKTYQILDIVQNSADPH